MATEYTDPQAVQAVTSAGDAFEKSLSESSPSPAVEVQPQAPVEEPKTEQAQEAGSPPVAEAAVAAVPSDEPEEYRNLLAKFNGDKGAAAKSWWETNNRAAEMARKVAEYEEKLKAQPASPAAEAPKPPAPEDIPAELKRYDDKLRATETSYRTTKEQHGQLDAEGKRLEQEIGKVVRQLASRDLTLDRDALNQKLVELHEQRAEVTGYLTTMGQSLAAMADRWEDLTHNRQLTERLLFQEREIREAREAKARTEEQSVVESIRTQFNSTIDKLTSDATLVPAALSEKCKKHVIRAVKAQLADNEPIADIDKFTRDEIAEFMAPAKDYHSVQSAEYAKQKQADAALSAPTGANAVASETKKPNADWTKEQWERHIEQVQL